MTVNTCITFDIDFSDYIGNWKQHDDFIIAVDLLNNIINCSDYKFTWYLRLDKQIKHQYSNADYIFRRYARHIDILKLQGHEIAWHPHSYRKNNGSWLQNTDTSEVLDELKQLIPLAKSHELTSVRMGWGFHTNDTMRLLADSGFITDSSAIPRPQYKWEETYKDWTISPNIPYYPSFSDYRIPGTTALQLLEIPMSVTHVKAPYDSEKVLRYLNPAYHSSLFMGPLKEWLSQYSHLITVTHPYELEGNRSHGLLSFDILEFEKNLHTIQDVVALKGNVVNFLTISEFANRWKGETHGETGD